MATIWDWSPTTPGSNANITGMPMPEGMQPAQVNDSIRNIMMVVAQAVQTSVTPTMYGVVGDGVTDDTAAFQAMLDSGRDVYVPPGTYHVGALTIATSSQKVVLAPEARLLAKTTLNGYFITITGDDVTLMGGIVDGRRASVAASHGIRIDAADLVTIDSVYVTSCKGYGIHANDCQYPRITNNYLTDIANHGIFVESTVVAFHGDALVSGNRVNRSGETVGIVGCGIKLLGNAATGQVRAVVAGNSVAMVANPVATDARGIELKYCFYSAVTGNVGTLGSTSVCADNCQEITITGNAGQIPKTYGIELVACTNLTVNGNSLSGGGTSDYGINLKDSYRCSITGNNFHSFDVAGIRIEGTVAGTLDHITITGNIVRDCTAALTNTLGGTAVLGTNIMVSANPGISDYLDYKNNLLIAYGTGTPEAVVTAGIGSTYHRKDGGAGTSHYFKESGVGNTGWVAK